MKKKQSLILLLVVVVVAALLLIFAPRQQKSEGLEGTVAQTCPRTLLQVGQVWQAQCKVMPGSSCTYYDIDGCEVVAYNAGTIILYPSMRAEIADVKVSGNIQYIKLIDMVSDVPV